ncbi:hypothetical protein PAXRUDRAFT_378994 [Paxillus rubicundulus Ve08.2h10]|uniref:Uncharacterized protein n=1 Tax=Paxillus rubicundulus Ve08.2h10 TaxID=930991 RepID=A0A0D0E975_9AGAM|nr:hypothetical protein PAXRUDRAFT_378994 [Paxillus rubicundulus Ve08.2h10]
MVPSTGQMSRKLSFLMRPAPDWCDLFAVNVISNSGDHDSEEFINSHTTHQGFMIQIPVGLRLSLVHLGDVARFRVHRHRDYLLRGM